MTQQTQDALVCFVEETYDADPFQELRIVWYGGEPTLGIDIIESLSGKLMRFCGRHGIPYWASMITNGYLLDRGKIERLYECGLRSAQISLGGQQDVHDKIRVSKTGESTFETVLSNAKALATRGIHVNVSYSMGCDNAVSCAKLQAEIGRCEHFHARTSPIDCYEDTREAFDKRAEQIHPLSLEGYAHAVFNLVMATHPDASELRAYLEPIRACCGSSLDRFYVIDELGNAYKCICGVSNPAEAMFNVNTPPERRSISWENLLPYTNRNPIRDRPECRACAVLPLCQGMCLYFERRPFMVWTCSDFKYNINDFVREYYSALVQEGRARV